MTLELLVEENGQILFPFMRPNLHQYVTNEIPYIRNCYMDFRLQTSSQISIDEFMAIHYCNPDSQYYAADRYHKMVLLHGSP
jgi:hypothetical protein